MSYNLQSRRLRQLDKMNSLLMRVRIKVIGTLGYLLLIAINHSVRWRTIGRADRAYAILNEKPVVIVFWHGRQLMMLGFIRKLVRAGLSRKFFMLSSRHVDGQTIARACGLAGVQTVFGSSSRGGAEALRSLAQMVEEGSHVGLTPDGPRGPARKAKLGAAKVSQITGAKIFPAAYSAERFWKFNSWDGMILPKPFSRGVWTIGEPIEVPEDVAGGELKAYLSKIEDALNEVTNDVDRYRYDLS